MAEISELARRFAASGHEQRARAPFYACPNRHISKDPAVLALLTAAPEEQQLPALLLATVHSIVLSEPDLELARWYPTTTDHPLDSDPFGAFSRLCADRSDKIREIVASRSVQTNEVGRCSLLVPGLATIATDAEPLSLVDVGTSAGLNLYLDRYEYVDEPGGRIGSPSTVRFRCSTQGAVRIPPTMPLIGRRVGLDRDPIDVTDRNAAQWLMACVWADQADRFERLEAAIDLARESPPELVRGDAVETLAGVVRSAAEHGHPVVTNSWMLNYLPPAAQEAYAAEPDALGQGLDLSWVYAESPGLCPGIPFPTDLTGEHITVLMVTRWRRGERTTRYLGTAHPHGYWWHAPDASNRAASRHRA